MTMVEDRRTADSLGSVSSGNALELRGVSKLFGALAAISDVTLTVRSGERRAVLGSNGAGKTTLFNCVTGDFLPTSGTIRLFEKLGWAWNVRWPTEKRLAKLAARPDEPAAV